MGNNAEKVKRWELARNIEVIKRKVTEQEIKTGGKASEKDSSWNVMNFQCPAH